MLPAPARRKRTVSMRRMILNVVEYGLWTLIVIVALVLEVPQTGIARLGRAGRRARL